MTYEQLFICLLLCSIAHGSVHNSVYEWLDSPCDGQSLGVMAYGPGLLHGHSGATWPLNG